MTLNRACPSETSPLLPNTTDGQRGPSDAPNGSLRSGTTFNGHANGPGKHIDGDRPQESQDREAQYEGMPDVKERLKYIVPAVSIGVSFE